MQAADRHVSQDEFEISMRRFDPFEARPILAVAVSGGPDSLALAILAQDWARKREGGVLGLIVDHGLRAASAAEARQTKAWLRARQIRGIVLRLRPFAHDTGLQDRARRERYRVLENACRRLGVIHLLLGHHADDQIETIVMREARQSGVIGMAGMAVVRELTDVRILRPLLDFPRARLKALLVKNGQPWIDDPSNRDANFERVRVRAQLAGQTVPYITSSLARRGRESELSRAIAETVSISPYGHAEIDLDLFADLDLEQQCLLLSRVVTTIGGREYAQSEKGLRDHAEKCAKFERGETLTHGGCLVRARAPGTLSVFREWARIDGEQIGHRTGKWDRRFAIDGHRCHRPIVPLGSKGWSWLTKPDRDYLRRRSIPREAVLGWPVLPYGESQLGLPEIANVRLNVTLSGMKASFRPCTPLLSVPFDHRIVV